MKTKPKSEVWEHFLRKTVNGKVVYDCKYCSAQYTKHATRMSKHVATCLKAPSSLKNTSANSAILRSKSRESLTEECKSTDNTIDQFNFDKTSSCVAHLSNSPQRPPHLHQESERLYGPIINHLMASNQYYLEKSVSALFRSSD